MKKILIVLIAILFTTGFVNAQINVDCNNNVGIGTTPSSYKLDINGGVKISPQATNSIYFDNSGYQGGSAIWGGAEVGTSAHPWFCMTSYYHNIVSDERLKENIRKIDNSLDLILKLNGKRYDYKSTPTDSEQLKKIKKNHAGYLAQEVVKLIPEAVLHDDSTDLYSIDYNKIIPFITEAMKEQQKKIENLEAEILVLKANAANTLKNGTITPGADDNQSVRVNKLQQNSPNPFSQTTTISYSLADNVQNAMICIYNMNGTQLKCIKLNQASNGSITIDSGELVAGLYFYTLIVNGDAIDTKRMILTD